MADDAGSADSPDALWDLFQGSRDAELRRRLIVHYLPLAQRVAARSYRYAIQPCSFEDYVQYANVGLIEAIDRYDRARDVPFEVYSRRRIRGAILNHLGQESEAAAQREFLRRAMPERLDSLAQGQQCSPEQASLQDLLEITVGVALGVLLDSEEVDVVDEAPHANPYAVTELAQLTSRARSLVDQLPEREREVIAGHYFERMEFQVLAQRLAVSKGRVSQLHGRALKRLQQLLSEPPRVNRAL